MGLQSNAYENEHVRVARGRQLVPALVSRQLRSNSSTLLAGIQCFTFSGTKTTIAFTDRNVSHIALLPQKC